MDFVFDKHSPMKAHTQIHEQVKLALLLGRLRPGDTLPSIRDVEKDVGISQHEARKAYQELQSLGILDLRHGKGVIVDKNLDYTGNRDISRKCEAVTQDVFEKLRHIGVTPTSFTRYLYQYAREYEARQPPIVFVDATRTIAEKRAASISSVWRMAVPGMSIEELAGKFPPLLRRIRKILTTYLRYDEVVRIVNSKQTDVIPLGLAFESATVREFSRFPPGSSVVFVIDDRDYPSLSMTLEHYRKILLNSSTTITSIPLRRIKDLKRYLHSTRHYKVMFSNRAWEKLSGELRHHRKVKPPHMAIDLGSLENARIQAGVII